MPIRCATDSRKPNASNLDTCDRHPRRVGLCEVDLCTALAEGSSIAEARVSGALIPADFSAEELNLSLSHGTRLRLR